MNKQKPTIKRINVTIILVIGVEIKNCNLGNRSLYKNDHDHKLNISIQHQSIILGETDIANIMQ